MHRQNLYDTISLVRENRNHIALRGNLHIRAPFRQLAADPTFTDNRAGNRTGRKLRALGGDVNVEDTARILKEMNVKEEDKITMCELFDQYTRRGRQEGLREGLSQGRQEGLRIGLSDGLQKGLQALISTCRELRVPFEETAARVKEKFSLGEEDTRKNMQLYW